MGNFFTGKILYISNWRCECKRVLSASLFSSTFKPFAFHHHTISLFFSFITMLLLKMAVNLIRMDCNQGL